MWKVGLFNHWYLKGDDMVALLKCSVWLTNTRIYNHCLCHLQFCSLLPFPLYIQCIYSVHFNVWVSVCCISPTTLNVFLKNSVARHDTEFQQSLKVADCATVPTQVSKGFLTGKLTQYTQKASSSPTLFASSGNVCVFLILETHVCRDDSRRM